MQHSKSKVSADGRQVADVERRTLDLLLRASELEATRPIDAEELRFKSSLCVFLSRCEKESLQKVCEVPCKLKSLSRQRQHLSLCAALLRWLPLLVVTSLAQTGLKRSMCVLTWRIR